MQTKAKDNKQTQNTQIWWAKGIADVNPKFATLFSLKIILIKFVSLRGLQNFN
jgi:hypothetical protein